MLPANPIPQVCNYGSSATYCSCPTDEQIAAGVIPLDSLPAAWWNWMWSKTNQAVNCARFTVGTLITELNTVLAQAGVCSCDACTDQLYQAITKLRRIVGDADYPGAVKSSSTPGQVSIDANGVMTANCVGNATQLTTASHTLVGAVNELKTCYDCCISDINSALGGKAPTGHASSNTTYGVGSSSDYGHLKISDTYASVLEACSGVAASQYALATAYSALANAGYTTLGNTVGCALGTAAAGTATTAAHSDHVHPLPTCVACAGTAACLGGLCSTCYEQKANLGTAAYCAATAFRASTWTPSLVACTRCIWNRPGSTEASKVCNIMFYAGCTNASCAATNYAACICGSNGWMYGLAGIFTPNIRANDPGSTASKNCCVTITAYCTNAGGDKTTANFTFHGSGYMCGNVCGNLCGLACLSLFTSYAGQVYKTAATDSAFRKVLLGEATESAGYGCVYYGNNSCPLRFNPATGVLQACHINLASIYIGCSNRDCAGIFCWVSLGGWSDYCYKFMEVYDKGGVSNTCQGMCSLNITPTGSTCMKVSCLRNLLYCQYRITENTALCYVSEYDCTYWPAEGALLICDKWRPIIGVQFIQGYGCNIRLMHCTGTYMGTMLYASCGECKVCQIGIGRLHMRSFFAAL